jgi:hypothetical protein
MTSAKTPIKVTVKTRLLTAAEFQCLADVPPEVEWFANIRNAGTRRAYETALKDFMRFTGINRPEEFRHLETTDCNLARARSLVPALLSLDGTVALVLLLQQHRLFLCPEDSP